MVTTLRTTNRPLPPGMEHRAAWFTPQPLWQKLARDELLSTRGRPALLRFETDTFMEDLLALLEGTPERLAEHVAQFETWREPDAGLTDEGRDKPRQLKLFQSSQSRFYLVAGALACKLPGVPDHQPDTTQRESVFFVLRRLIYEELLGRDVEYAWATGQPSTQTQLPESLRPLLRSRFFQEAAPKGWTAVANPGQTVLANEERLPLFPMRFKLHGVPRTLYAGMVPVSSRETYQAPSLISPLPSGSELNQPGGDPRQILFAQQVTEPLQHLRAFITGLGGSFTQQDRDVLSRAFLYTLLDLMALLHDNVSGLYGDIMAGRSLSGTLGSLIQAVVDNTGNRLSGVLRRIEQDRAQIEALEADDDLRSEWVFALTREQLGGATLTWLNAWLGAVGSTATAPIESAFHAATGDYEQPEEGPLALTPEIGKIEAGTGARYVIRLVYDKPCCGEVTVSDPSRPFTLAPFFDPDAPARKVRIPLPGDTSIEGLRKFDKGVAIELSKQLRAQMQRISGLRDLMEGKVKDEEGLDFGMICSLSIPIITICALILLMIIVQLLNIVFWWLPFFKICLPIRR